MQRVRPVAACSARVELLLPREGDELPVFHRVSGLAVQACSAEASCWRIGRGGWPARSFPSPNTLNTQHRGKAKPLSLALNCEANQHAASPSCKHKRTSSEDGRQRHKYSRSRQGHLGTPTGMTQYNRLGTSFEGYYLTLGDDRLRDERDIYGRCRRRRRCPGRGEPWTPPPFMPHHALLVHLSIRRGLVAVSCY